VSKTLIIVESNNCSMEEQTLEAITEHGSVEYEVVECDSCGMDTTKESAQRFYIGEVKETEDWHYLNHIDVKFTKDTVRKGWACQHCHDGDVAGLPSEKRPSSDVVDRLVQSVFNIIVDVALLPQKPLKTALKRKGLSREPDVGLLSDIATIIWMTFVTLFMLSLLNTVLALL